MKGAKAIIAGLPIFGWATLLLLGVSAAAQQIIRDVRYEISGTPPVFTTAKAAELAALQRNKPMSYAEFDVAAQRLREACQLRGYPLAEVNWDIRRVDPEIDIAVFSIKSGQQGWLREVKFQENRQIADKSLFPVLQLKARRNYLYRKLGIGAITGESLETDRKAILQRYQSLGYAKAEVGEPKVEWEPRLNGYSLTWPIVSEGACYSVGKITFSLEKVPDRKVLQSLIGVKPGGVYSRSSVQVAAQRLRNHYQEEGYPFPEVNAFEEWSDESTKVDLIFTADLGQKPRLGKITTYGNEKISDRMIKREIKLKKGDFFDYSEFRLAQSRLASLPLFSETDLLVEGAHDLPDYDLVARVVEKPTGRIEIGMVYGESEGLAFYLGLREHNLALAPPFRGDALQGNLGTTLGNKTQRVDGSLMNPRLRDSDWNGEFRLFFEDNEAVSDFYNQRSYGGNLLSGYRLGEHNLLTAGYSATGYDIYNEKVLEESGIDTLLNDDQDILVTSLVFLWNSDYSDRMIRPTRGIRMHAKVALGNKALGGDTDVIETAAGGSLFLRIYGQHVISLRASLESVDGYGDNDTVPLPLRLYLGGSRNLRGFAYRTVSPGDEHGRLVGGESMWSFTMEYRLPLLRWLDMAVYYDMGDVGDESYKFSGEGPVSNWGIGFLIQAEEFPVRFDVAAPIRTMDGDEENEKNKLRFSFSAGYIF